MPNTIDSVDGPLRISLYLAPGARLMAVGVQTEPSLAPGNAEEVFGGYQSAVAGSWARTYDISPDGERFLMIKGKCGQRLDGVHHRHQLVRGN